MNVRAACKTTRAAAVTTTTTNPSPATAKATAGASSRETGECTSAGCAAAVAACTEKTTASSTVTVAGTAVPVSAATTKRAAAVRAGEAPSSNDAERLRGPTARTGDNQRRITRADHKTTATATATAARATYGDLQRLTCGKIEVAADLRSPASCECCV